MMYGKLRVSRMALGLRARLVATMTSRRLARATACSISGTGVASANTIGKRAIDRTISCVSTPPADAPMNTSAPFDAFGERARRVAPRERR